jgi:hypothetical protein
MAEVQCLLLYLPCYDDVGDGIMLIMDELLMTDELLVTTVVLMHNIIIHSTQIELGHLTNKKFAIHLHIMM